MPWPIPRAQEIFARMAAFLEQKLSILKPDVDPTAISRSVRSSHGLISLLNRPVALETREIHDHIAYFARQYFPDTAEQEYVERHAAIWGIIPRPASFAMGDVIIEGDAGVTLPEGIEFSTSKGTIIYTTQSAKIDESGSVRISVRSSSSGLVGNLEAGTLLKTVEPFSEIRRALIAAPGLSGGTDAESWQELQQRVLERIRQPPHGGAGFDYIEWLTAKFDVRAVSVIPDWIGRGSVGIVVAMKDGNSGRTPTEDEIKTMMDYIGEPGSPTGVRPVTAHIVIVPARQRILPLRVRVRPYNVATKKAIKEAWEAFILTVGDKNDDFNDSPIGATIECSRISEALSSAAGEYAHDLIEPSTSITLDRTEYPIAGNVIFESPR